MAEIRLKVEEGVLLEQIIEVLRSGEKGVALLGYSKSSGYTFLCEDRDAIKSLVSGTRKPIGENVSPLIPKLEKPKNESGKQD